MPPSQTVSNAWSEPNDGPTCTVRLETRSAPSSNSRGLSEEAMSLHVPTLAARLDVELGQALMETGAYDDAVTVLELAYTRGMAADDDVTASAAAMHLMEIHTDIRREYERGLEWGRLAGSLLDRHEGAKRFYLNFSYATTYWRRGELDLALEHIEQAKNEMKEGTPSPTKTAGIHEMTGILAGETGDYERSLAESQEALRIQTELLGPGPPYVGEASQQHGCDPHAHRRCLGRRARLSVGAGDLGEDARPPGRAGGWRLEQPRRRAGPTGPIRRGDSLLSFRAPAVSQEAR